MLTTQSLSSGLTGSPLFLLVLATSVILAACYALQLLFALKSVWLNRICTLLLLMIAGIITVDVIDRTRDAMTPVQHLIVSVATFAGVTSLCCLQVTLLLLSPRLGRVVCGLIQGTLVLSCAAAAYHCENRFSEDLTAITDFGFLDICPGEMEESQEFVGLTDQGTRFPLYRWVTTDANYATYVASSPIRLGSHREAVIERARPDRQANCHGWVFTGGKFLLRGWQIEHILKDNGYTRTELPQPGDLAVYRDPHGTIVHTGLVRGVLDEGTVIVESKWGIDGRYLHRPEDQPYTPNFAYYHTIRPTHLVTLAETQNGRHVTATDPRQCVQRSGETAPAVPAPTSKG